MTQRLTSLLIMNGSMTHSSQIHELIGFQRKLDGRPENHSA